jgi:arylsulfatase A-like enzyme
VKPYLSLLLTFFCLHAPVISAPVLEVIETRHPTEDVVVAVKSAGLKNDRSADVAVALQRQLDALAKAGAGTLFVAAGKYRLDAPRPLAWRMDDVYAFRDEGDWKLVGSAERQFLYNLKDDPLEKRDLATANPDKLADLFARWKKWDAENARPMWRSASEGAKKPTGADNRRKRDELKKKHP